MHRTELRTWGALVLATGLLVLWQGQWLEDRLGTGLAPSVSIEENLVLKSYRWPPVARGPFLSQARMRADTVSGWRKPMSCQLPYASRRCSPSGRSKPRRAASEQVRNT